MSAQPNNAAEEFVDALLAAEEAEYHSSMEPFSSYAARRKAVLLEQLEEEGDQFGQGYRYILEDLRSRDEVPLEEYVLSEERMSVFKDEEKMRLAHEEKKSYQEILGISDKQIFTMYEAASRYFENDQYKESAAAFTFLTQLNDNISAFWIGLGSSYRAVGDLETALSAYHRAIMADAVSIEPYVYTASCYLEMKDTESIKELFATAVDFAENNEEQENPEVQAFKEQVKGYLELLERGEV